MQIKWGSALSEPISVHKGTRQGGLSSPFLFNLFYQDMINELSECTGCIIINMQSFNVFCYADDLMLASLIVIGLQTTINVANRYITEHGLQFNPNETDCVIIGRSTLVPALGDPRRERPPAVYGHFVNVPTHFDVKLPVINGHLPNADADSHLLVVSTCYNGQFKQMPRFRWSFQPEIACAHPTLGPTVLSNFRAVVW